MTREEVRAQLAKSPLEWDCTDPFDLDGERVVDHYAELMEVSEGADVFYTIREVFDDNETRTRAVLYLSTMDVVQHMYSPYEIVLSPHNDTSVDDIKMIADEDRIKRACSLLGIEDKLDMDQKEVSDAMHTTLKWVDLVEYAADYARLMAQLIYDESLVGTYYIEASSPSMRPDYDWDFTLKFEKEETGDIDVVCSRSIIGDFLDLSIEMMKREADTHCRRLILRHLHTKE